MTIKGKKDNIQKALEETGWYTYTHEEEQLPNGTSLMRIEIEDEFIDVQELDLAKYDDLKFIILAAPEIDFDDESTVDRTDVIIFKDYKSDKLIIKNAYTTPYGSLYQEELEGIIFFPDQEFSYDYTNYACGEKDTLEYDFSVKEQWENDSGFTE